MQKHKIWETQPLTASRQNLTASLSEALNVSGILAQVLLNRGIDTIEKAKLFLNPEFSCLHNPFRLPAVEVAVKRIWQAIENQENICIYGDFDVDGITSTVLLMSVLRELGGRGDFYIPNRFDEGYGLNSRALKLLKEKGFSLIITVDCGITAREEIVFANNLGLDIIVTDHHDPPPFLPPALAIINPKLSQPNQPTCPPLTASSGAGRRASYPFPELAGVGVAFKLAQAIMSKVQSPKSEVQQLTTYLDLVTLGTVADVVPLVDENRILVKKGLEILNDSNQSLRPGFKALIEVAGLTGKKITASHIGYWLAPRLNASGRLAEATQAVQLLLTEDEEEAKKIAKLLDEKNRHRQTLEEQMLTEAIAMLEKEKTSLKNKVIVLASENWHEGVKGIVASRIVDRYCRPTFLFSLKGATAKGSARSIASFNLSKVLSKVSDLLDSYGGHAFAAGLRLPARNLDLFRDRLNDEAEEILTEEDLTPKLQIDSGVNLFEISPKLLRELESLGPYGTGNPNPIFALESVILKGYQRIGNGKHFKFLIDHPAPELGHSLSRPKNTSPQFRGGVEGIAFNFDTKFIDQLEQAASCHPLVASLAFWLERNEWNGREKIQLKLADLKLKTQAKVEPDIFIENLFKNANKIIKPEDYKNIGDTLSFYTKVVGVTFEGRQDIVITLTPGAEINLIREPENPHDQNAIKVEDKNGRQLGYLNARLAKQLAPCLDSGIEFGGRITEITGNQEKKLGINVQIERKESPKSKVKSPKSTGVRQELKALSDAQLVDRLRREFVGENQLRDKQVESLNCLFAGKNCLTIMGTGRGKSAIFQIISALKAIKENKVSILVFPLRALVNDQHHYLKTVFDRIGLSCAEATGDLTASQRQNIFEALVAQKIDAILTTPEFLYHHLQEFGKIKNKISFFVVDESHHLCTSSQAHRPLYKKLAELIPLIDNPQVLAITATANEKIATQICHSLNIEEMVIDPTVRTNLTIVDKRETENKDGYVRSIISSEQKSIVYVNSREQSVRIAAYLRESLPHLRNRIAYYNAGLNQESRSVIEDRFRKGNFCCIVTTSAFGEGINIPDIRHIFLYHLNFNFIEFNQQSGRAGRDDKEAFIHLLFGREDARINDYILESTAPSRENLKELYRAIKSRARNQKLEVEDIEPRASSLQHKVQLSNQEILYEMELRLGRVFLNEKGISAGLKILEELGLLALWRAASYQEIELLPAPGERLDLEKDSVRYEEGLHEKQMFESFKNWALESDSKTLLEMIDQPIYPKNKLDY